MKFLVKALLSVVAFATLPAMLLAQSAPLVFNNGRVTPMAPTQNISTGAITATGVTSTVSSAQNLHGISSYSGSFSGYTANELDISSDNANLGGNFGVGLYVQQLFGGSSAYGGRSGIWVDAKNSGGATNTANTNRNYVGVTGQGWATSTDGGTGLTVATAKGAFFGLSGNGIAASGATNLLNVTGAELNTSVQTGASVAVKTILQLVGQGNDAVGGTLEDDMLGMWDQNGASGHAVGIRIGNGGGTSQWPIKSTGALFQTSGSGSAALGIDLVNTTFSSYAFRSAGFTVGPTGAVNAAQVTITSGNPQVGFVDAANGNYSTMLQATAGCTRLYDNNASVQIANFCSTGTTFGKPAILPSYTVSTLPTCNTSLKGGFAYVTDATAPTYNGALTGGGAVIVPAFCNGTAWSAH